MAYRSQVGIKCEENVYNDLMEVCQRHNEFPHYVYYNQDNHCYTLEWDWVKWYETSDPYVCDIMTVLYKYDNFQDDVCEGDRYQYCYIGEDINDNEEKGNAWLDFSIYRHFPIDGFEIQVIG